MLKGAKRIRKVGGGGGGIKKEGGGRGVKLRGKSVRGRGGGEKRYKIH
jgi:hypothetical protein